MIFSSWKATPRPRRKKRAVMRSQVATVLQSTAKTFSCLFQYLAPREKATAISKLQCVSYYSQRTSVESSALVFIYRPLQVHSPRIFTLALHVGYSRFICLPFLPPAIGLPISMLGDRNVPPFRAHDFKISTHVVAIWSEVSVPSLWYTKS